MIHEEYVSLQKNYLNFQIYTDRNPENMLGMVLLSIWDNDGRNIKMDLAELLDMEPLNRDSAFNTAWAVRNVSNISIGLLAETGQNAAHKK